MALFKSAFATGSKPVPVAESSDVVVYRATIPVTALATGDVYEMGALPADHQIVDFIVDSDDLDTNASPTVSLQVGILNAAKTAVSTAAADGGAVWLTTNVAQAGGVARPTTNAFAKVAPSTATRSVGIVATAGSATFQAGTLGLTLLLRTA